MSTNDIGAGDARGTVHVDVNRIFCNKSERIPRISVLSLSLSSRSSVRVCVRVIIINTTSMRRTHLSVCNHHHSPATRVLRCCAIYTWCLGKEKATH